jgi:hypothetical protein
MGAGVGKIGTPAVMYRCSPEVGKYPDIVYRLASPLVVGAVTGEPLGRGDMQPLPFPVHPYAGLVEVGNGGVDNLPLDLIFYRLQYLACGHVCVDQGSLAELVAEQIVKQLACALVGKQLVLAQVDGDSSQARTVLHRLGDIFGESCLVLASASGPAS